MTKEYTGVERAYIEAARGTYTVDQVAAHLGREPMAVYMMARRMGIRLKPKPMGTLDLNERGTILINFPLDGLERYQSIIQRIGKRFGLTSKAAVGRKVFELAEQWLEDNE